MKRQQQGTGNWTKLVDRILSAYNDISKSLNPTQLLKIDLTSSQVKVIMTFSEHDTFTMTELSNAHCVSVSTMTSMVDRLISNGFMERHKDTQDRRIVRVKLSEHGRKMMRQLMKMRRQELEKFLLKLQDSEITQFVKSIENVARYLAIAKADRE